MIQTPLFAQTAPANAASPIAPSPAPSAFPALTDPYAAAIIADLLTHVWLAADGAPIIEEALDYLATARREHPSQPIAPTVAEWLDATLTELTLHTNKYMRAAPAHRTAE